MTDYAATIWKCSVANAQKLTPNTTGSGSEKQTGGASLDIVNSSRKMSSRCMQARWSWGQIRSTAILVRNNRASNPLKNEQLVGHDSTWRYSIPDA
jgi:hypothetical protein